MTAMPTVTGAKQAGGEDERRAMARAILEAVAYADVFDYPLTLAEVHRYLLGVAAPVEAVRVMLEGGGLSRQLTWRAGYLTLAGREALVATRQRRAAVAAARWPRAWRYGRVIAGLPFVRMVAVTGALALDNVEPGTDIDYLIVTEPGRLWLCRALVILVVRLAARRGDLLCPNYLLSARALALTQRDLFAAHELTQMRPLAGLPTYQAMRRLNAWTAEYLPNAVGAPPGPPALLTPQGPARRLTEAVLRSPLGGRLEQWEMARKLRRFGQGDQAEAAFGPDWCKGHVDRHGQRTLAAFAARRRRLAETAP